MRLFLDDVEDVHALLDEHCASVSIHAAHAVADTVDDLRGATRAELRELKLVSQSPDIVVQLGRGSVIQTSDGRAGSWELAARVDVLLKPYTFNRDPMPLLALGAAVFVVGMEQLVQWQYGPAGIVTFLLLAMGIKTWLPCRQSRGGA
ncbi:hypothetical protein [Streptomyces sp. NPDC016845]|uniref:hypothetical protein n=1 Tax=Streptomyces sp. NPDC016845 TaxID=3364972 RepID=UPI0037AA8FDE